MNSLFRVALPILLIGLCVVCGPRSASERERSVLSATEVVEVGAGPLEGRLSIKAPESMAIQEVPFSPDPGMEKRFEEALARYRNQWTFQLSIGPKPGAKAEGSNRFALDIENNGGMWGDHSRNLRRLMFEMGAFIRLRLPDGTELEPTLVEFQRSFGMGLDRSFVMVFPRRHQGRDIRPPFEIRVKEFGQGMGTLGFRVKTVPDEMARGQALRLWKAEGSESK